MKIDAIDRAIETYLKMNNVMTVEEYKDLTLWEKHLYIAYWTKKKYEGYTLEVMSVDGDRIWQIDEDAVYCIPSCLYRICPTINKLESFLKEYVRKDGDNNAIISFNPNFLLDLHEYISYEIYLKKGDK